MGERGGGRRRRIGAQAVNAGHLGGADVGGNIDSL